MTQSLIDRIKSKRQAMAAKNFEKPLKLSSDKNILRILPNWAGDPDGAFYQDFGQHYIKDKNNVLQAVYICTANTFGKACDVCAAVAQAASELDPTDTNGAKLIHEARGGNRVLVNAVYVSGSHPSAKTDAVLVELAPSVFDMILGIAEDYLTNHQINIFDLAEGYDVTVTKTGSGLDTKYAVVPSPKPRAIDKSVLPKCKDLAAYAAQEYEQGLQKALVAVRTTFHSTGSAAALLAGGHSAPALSAPGGGSTAPAREFIPASRPEPSKLAATNAMEMDEVLVAEVEAQFVASTPAPAAAPKPAPTPAAPAPSSAQSELDELEALLADPSLKAA